MSGGVLAASAPRRVAALLLVANGLLPALWILLSSVESPAGLARLPFSLLRHGPTLQNYLRTPLLLRVLLNGVAVAAAAAVVAVVLGGLAAYALARLPVRRRGLVLLLLLVSAALPSVVLLPPLVEAAGALGLQGTRAALVLPDAALALPVCTLLLLGAFEAMPAGLEEAAMLDGCSRLGALRHVVVPLARPALLAAFLLAFIGAWDEFLFALSLAGPAARSLPAGVALLRTAADFPWPQIAAGLALGIAPVAILAVVFQERVIAGIGTGGMRA